MLNGERKIARPLRWAMVGGGRLSQVGYKHRCGALQDNTAFQLVAGAFDLDPERGRDFGAAIGVDPQRCYADYRTMFREEAEREDGIEVVSIATPNTTHFEIARAALNAGLHVICEKPLFFTTDEVREVKALAEKKGLIVGVTYGYSGHPLLMQMRAMIARVRSATCVVDLQYTHGFNATDDVEKASDAQKWRVDPKISGPTFVLGDISTHTYYLSQLVMPQIELHSFQGTARGQRLRPHALRERGRGPLVGFLDRRRLHGQPAHPHRRFQGQPRLVGRQSQRAALRGAGSAEPDTVPGHAVPGQELQRHRAPGRPSHRRTDRVLSEHLSQVRHRHRRQEPRRRADAGQVGLSRHPSRIRRCPLAGELRAVGQQRVELGAVRVTRLRAEASRIFRQ
jgi:hypothetical protein